MPLVIPGLTSKDGDNKTSKWMNDLVGKKIGDNSNETVSFRSLLSNILHIEPAWDHDVLTW
jgi:hypothetical protein